MHGGICPPTDNRVIYNDYTRRLEFWFFVLFGRSMIPQSQKYDGATGFLFLYLSPLIRSVKRDLLRMGHVIILQLLFLGSL